jgi:hypothetical protein
LYELAPASWAQLLLMYLLWYNEDDDFFSLVKVEGNDDVPTYAILSHTWGSSDDELNFREVMNIAGVYRRGLNKDKKPTGSHKLWGTYEGTKDITTETWLRENTVLWNASQKRKHHVHLGGFMLYRQREQC